MTRVSVSPTRPPGGAADLADVVRALRHAIHVVRRGEYDPMVAHERVKGMYSWADVAARTEIVYERAMATPHRDTGERLARWANCDVH